jgi:hypothetical protein
VKEYQLQVNDVLKGRHFEDTVATGGWGLEWKENWASEFRLPDDGCFEIPPGCLRSVDTANLFLRRDDVSTGSVRWERDACFEDAASVAAALMAALKREPEACEVRSILKRMGPC